MEFHSLAAATGNTFIQHFHEGQQTIEDDRRSGRLLMSRTVANVDRVCELLMWDRRLSIRMMAEELHIPHEIVTEVTELSHPPYSPNLAPLDFFIFRKLKCALKGHRFSNISHVQSAVMRELKAVQKENFSRSFQQFYKHQQCIISEEAYSEGLQDMYV
uniref:Tc1-like transposase DDE domain-containing protein n=1 Tax=Podarcis muralis TaxID=64176 RepID=A0A670K390_PODMU